MLTEFGCMLLDVRIYSLVRWKPYKVVGQKFETMSSLKENAWRNQDKPLHLLIKSIVYTNVDYEQDKMK